MSDLPKYLNRLEDALFDVPEDADAMTVSEVDGFLTGLLLIPQEIRRDEWLPLVWRRDPDAPDYLFHDRALLDEIAELVEKHRRMLARDLHNDDYAPIFDVDTRHDDILWEIWMEGFDRAMALRPDAFSAIETASEDVRNAFSCMDVLATLAVTPFGDDHDAPEAQPDALPGMTRDERDALTKDAPDLIPACVQMLYNWTRSLRPTPEFAIPVRRPSIGRNDPCPCGSGKKYKKCCGAS